MTAAEEVAFGQRARHTRRAAGECIDDLAMIPQGRRDRVRVGVEEAGWDCPTEEFELGDQRRERVPRLISR